MSTTQTVQQTRPGAAASGERTNTTSASGSSSNMRGSNSSNAANTAASSGGNKNGNSDGSVNNNSNNNGNSNSNSNSNNPAIPDKSEVGWLFVQQYYTFLNEQPNKLHLFYTKQSTLCHGVEGESVPSYYGQTQITQRIKERQFNDCKVLISNMDCQESANGGVVVQVLGEMGNNGQRSQKFVQTFFLAQQPRGYYVLNDIFRFLKEDISEDTEALTSTPSTESTATTAVTSSEDQVASVAATGAEPAQAQPTAAIKEQPKESQAVPVKPAQQQQPAQQQHSEAKPAAKSIESKKSSEADKAAETKPVAASKSNTDAAATQTSSTPNGPSKSTASLSWASLAAKKKESDANGHITPAKPVATQQPATTTAATTAATKPATAASSPANNNIIVTTKPGHVPGRKPQDFHSAYIRNVSKVDDNLLRKGLEKIGQLTHFQVEKAKNCAFVDFIDAATLKAALAVQELRVGDQVVLIEERKRGGAKNKNNYPNSKKGGFTNVNKNGKKAL